jgi:hypothetical protein
MRLRDYFVGQPVCLKSLLSARTVASRINAQLVLPFWPFNTGDVGGVGLGRVRLRHTSSFGEYNAKPVLAGQLRETTSGSILMLRYRAPAWIYLFDLFWYSLLGGVTLVMLGLVGEKNPDLAGRDLVIFSVGLIAMFIIPLVLHYIGTRNSEQELGYMLNFLAEHADAKL